jgi:hypothetical protein
MQGQWREINTLVETVQPIVEGYGTPAVRARFFLNLALMLMRRDGYVCRQKRWPICRTH